MSGKRAEGAVKIRSLPTRRTVTVLALLGALVLGFALQDAGLARAHFLLNLNIRVIHVEHLDDGLRVYLRLPANVPPAATTAAPTDPPRSILPFSAGGLWTHQISAKLKLVPR